jgi:hypothetical protein
MGKPITTNSGGVCFAFPNVCLTPAPPGPPIPIPYPSVGQLSNAQDTASSVLAGSSEVVTTAAYIESTNGDEPALPTGGVTSGNRGGPVIFQQGSGSVNAEGNPVVRMFDPTGQNTDAGRNAPNASGAVLGGFPTVLVGG